MNELTVLNNISPVEVSAWQLQAVELRNRIMKTGTAKLKYLLAVEIHQFFSYELDSNRLMLYRFLWNTGARISEALELKVKDITIGETMMYVTIKTAKLKKNDPEYRNVDLNPELIHQLKMYIKTNNLKMTDNLFNVTYHTFLNYLKYTQRSAESDGVTFPIKITPNVFRHSYAVHLYYNRVDKKIISKNLGHKQFRTTEIYTDILAIETAFLRDIKF